jgi:hypothetical protein
MTEMIFVTCQRLQGYIWCSVVRDLIVERWQTIFSGPIPQSFWNILYLKRDVSTLLQNKQSAILYFLLFRRSFLAHPPFLHILFFYNYRNKLTYFNFF